MGHAIELPRHALDPAEETLAKAPSSQSQKNRHLSKEANPLIFLGGLGALARVS
jgi:hypothetical protein